MHPEISESARFPLLTPSGRRLLHAMRQHESAPIWNWPNGEQLDASGLQKVRDFSAALRAYQGCNQHQLPDWLEEFVDYCLEDVPFYRRRSRPGSRFHDIPSCSREDLANRVWDFVPDSQPLDHLIVFSSSGTTGHPAKLPTHPATAACGVPLLEYAMEWSDRISARGSGTLSNGNSVGKHRFPRGPQSMALTNIVAYRDAYTTAIVISYLEEAGCIRINLCDEDWRAPGDCRRFLDRWHSPVMLGDPLTFAALEQVGLERPPQVMISSITHLSAPFAQELSARYGCPVLDLYALTEAGIVALKTEQGHVILPPDLYVEVLNEFDQPCPPGERGEITLTGGRNPFGPLLRYRTGDFGALVWQKNRPVIVELEGRPPVLFVTSSGSLIHSMEIARRLRQFPLVQFQLHQEADGSFRFGFRGGVNVEDVRSALMELLDHPRSLSIDKLEPPGGSQRKVLEFRSEFKLANARSPLAL